MLTRSAIFQGTIHPGKEEAFFDLVENRLLPIWQRMPGAQAVRLFRPIAKDDAAPQVLFVQQIDYPDLTAIDIALASPVRDEAVAASDALYQLFDGHHYHYIFEKLTD
ncbi:hypothetical protein [Cohaesibacter celericrescens]|uniref:Ethyl tert-butyl ether degradation EthD n=1 Tax=Cohaesibacter celericrescens TaxID=2067669 RepID=A0A2N5XRB5_9HYPH|nr:hypothetical protein [Cohaesibacter celericrescens]PLW77062.1 hypothetical protein C0081_13570 [Cohaesibacter celericrescens]